MKPGFLFVNKRRYPPWGLVAGPLVMVAGLLVQLSNPVLSFVFLLLTCLLGPALIVYGASALLCRRDDFLGKAAFVTRRVLQIGVVLAVLLVGVIQTLIAVNAKSDTPADCDVLLVLGAGLDGSRPSVILARRLDVAADYMAAHPSVTCVVSGGQGPHEDIPEGDAMQIYLVARGIDASRIAVERQATDTEENIVLSLPLLAGRGRVGLVTTDAHLYRAKLLCRRAGLDDVVGLAAPAGTQKWAVLLRVRETGSVLLTWLGL